MLLTAIKNTPLLRPNALPMQNNLGIICLQSAFFEIPDILLYKAQAIFVINANYEQLNEMSNSIFELKQIKVPVLLFNEISSNTDLIFVFYHNKIEYHPIGHCFRYMRNFGYESFYTFMPISTINSGISLIYNKYYYENNRENLEKVYSILTDEDSKSVFAARIRAIVSGAVGYLKVSEYEEYFHPLIKPEIGDVILDGGVSEYVTPQIGFINTIGPTGKWFGFEPDPIGFSAASERIKKSATHDNYEIIPFGLWHKRSKLRFEIQGQGTHFIKFEKQNTIESDVVSVDEFVEDRCLGKVNYIKLDVEGAEFNALKGGMRTIKKCRPKLAVSLYHQLKDLYSIPLFLKEICVDYEFYLGHHHSAFHETILYAKPKSL